MPWPYRVDARISAACLLSVVSLLPVDVRAQTSKPAAPRAQPAPRKPAVRPAAPKPAPAVTKPVPPPDVTVKVKYVNGENATTSTVSTKGARQRIEYGTELVVLQECDLGRIVQVSDQNRKYLVAASGKASAAIDPPPAAKTGGVVTYTSAVTDTGERKEMFNVTARHLKTVLTKEVTPQSCDKKKERVETDGWFIDPPAGAQCDAAPRSEAPAAPNPECRDEIRYTGPDISTLGYPVAYTITMTAEDGKTSSMAMEVTDLTRSTLPDTLFDVPDGYTEVKTLQELTRGLPEIVPDKQVGTLRVGVAPISSKADGVSLEVLHEALVISLGEAEVDAVALSGATAAELAADARAKDSDFVLTTEIAEVRQGGGNRVLGRLSGTPGDSFSAKVDFKLFPVGSLVPRLSDSERSGTSTLRMAIGAAKTVSRYATPLGLMGSRYNFMGAFSQLGAGTSSGTMQQSPDPVLNTVFSMVDRYTGTPEVDLKSEDAAVASAMEREVKAVASEIKKKR